MYSLFGSQWTTDGNGTEHPYHKKRAQQTNEQKQKNNICEKFVYPF